MPVAEAEAEAAAAPVEASTHSPGNDDSIILTSPLSTPTTATSPVSPTFLSVAGRVSTPLSLFLDSAPSSGKKKSSTSPEPESAAALRQRYLAMSPTASANAPGAGSVDARKTRPAEAGRIEEEEESEAEAEGEADKESESMRRTLQEEEEQDEAGWREKNLSSSAGAGTVTSSGPPLPWSPTNNSNVTATGTVASASASASASATSTSTSLSPPTTAGDIKHGISRGVISAPLPQSPNRHERPSISARGSGIATIITGAAKSSSSNSSTTASIATVASGSNNNPGTRTATVRIPAAAAPEEAPLHMGSVQPDTRLAHPKPILHIATDISLPSRHSHHSDLLTHSASAVSNVAHLEATAERLSMTSSIDDAIRELHCELKRSDSRRSSILAARAASADEHSTRLRRYPSNSSSSAAAAARQRGYSPAYVMSPTNSLTGRMRSGSNASAGRLEHDTINSILSRHGPGKSSVRSVRSAKPSLAEISESEPISLTQHVLDQVDAVPPFEHAAAAAAASGSRIIVEQDAVGVLQTDEFHDMIGGGFRSHRVSNLVLVNPDLPSDYDQHQDYEAERPMTANSTSTFQVARDAFVDFDGAHCETDNEDDRFATADMGSRLQKRDRLSDTRQLPVQLPPPQMAQPQARPPVLEDDLLPTPQGPSTEFVRPQSYFDQQSGQHMLYYPARVPAMLNLPPKLSHKPKAADRNQRRSQILSAMMQPKENKKKSIVPDLDQFALPDPLSGHRNSFAALSVAGRLEDVDDATTPTPFLEEPVPQSRNGSALSLEDLRHPQRLSKMDADKRKSNMPNLENIPPHLRASVFFEQPSLELPEIEVKDGSAMATLESILDASATAPVSAFTDHLYAGKLGSEVYGKEKKKVSKHKSQQLSTNTLGVALAESAPKEQSTIRLLTKRSQNSLFGRANKGPGPNDNAHDGADEEGEGDEEGGLGREEEEELDEGILDGMPTTLLGEIHLRKQQQKQRILNQGNIAPQGMRATLLEMDAVAEMQRKQRLKNRVNLAWEEQNFTAEQNISDDEDMPLAVIAALHQGAKNMADVERPLGLMEVRQLEENEPLSQRAARLQGRGSTAFAAQRQSNLTLPATRMAEVQPPAPSPRIVEPDVGADDDARTTIAADPEPLATEIEEETLGARKRRLAESQLPKARPVSSTFSAELLGQFASPEEPKAKGSKSLGVEDETLGQRRRRLQAEREAREREMSYGNLTGERPVSYGNPTVEPFRRGMTRRVSMADMLSVHQIAQDPRVAEERRRQEEQMRMAEQDARMAAMRSQMPTALVQPGNPRTGGFKGGLYNDGTGGLGMEAAKSTTALNAFQSRSFTNTGARNRATMMVPPNGYGMAQGGMQPPYGTLTSFKPASMNGMSPMGGMSGMKPMTSYGAGNLYGANGLIQPSVGVPMSNPNGSMDRVERWRQGVFP